MFDLEKLTPAPWRVCPTRGEEDPESGADTLIETTADVQYKAVVFMGWYDGLHLGCTKPDAAFIALARNAFDVMMRRGWNPLMTSNGWSVSDFHRKRVYDKARTFRDWVLEQEWPDPFTALVEADRWMKEQEASKQQ
jgi:hypothetical protein